MSSTPNYKARINRALRNNVRVPSVAESFRKIKWFTVFLVVIFPIYPSLAAITGAVSVTDVGSYDESTILASFTDTEGLDYISEDGLVTVKTDSLSGAEDEAESSENLKKTPVPQSNVKTYTVVEYDDVIKIGKKFNMEPEVILWSNNLSMSDTLRVGQVLKIPPVSGLVHILQPRETVSDLARIYNVSSREILEFNNIADATKIRDGAKLMIPGAVRPPVVEEKSELAVPKKSEKPVEKPKNTEKKTEKKADKKAEKDNQKATKKSEESKVEAPEKKPESKPLPNGLKDRYSIKFTGMGRGFVAGNCTWHVARNKNVTWRGNANQWIRNARAKGVPTGKTPIVGSIVQFSGHGYNSYYGHVGIVTDITDEHIIVSDMNYRGLYEVTIRKVPKNSPAIDGYIYVD